MARVSMILAILAIAIGLTIRSGLKYGRRIEAHLHSPSDYNPDSNNSPEAFEKDRKS